MSDKAIRDKAAALEKSVANDTNNQHGEQLAKELHNMPIDERRKVVAQIKEDLAKRDTATTRFLPNMEFTDDGELKATESKVGYYVTREEFDTSTGRAKSYDHKDYYSHNHVDYDTNTDNGAVKSTVKEDVQHPIDKQETTEHRAKRLEAAMKKDDGVALAYELHQLDPKQRQELIDQLKKDQKRYGLPVLEFTQDGELSTVTEKVGQKGYNKHGFQSGKEATWDYYDAEKNRHHGFDYTTHQR